MKTLTTSILMFFAACGGDQKPDLSYDTSVAKPAYSDRHPVVLFDEAHNNFHTADERYRPFADLITNDGYLVERNHEVFSAERLAKAAILVISNARGKEKKYESAFTDEENRIVRDWVQQGGSLLLIADHYPMGGAAQSLARMFGVGMSNGYTSDSLHYQGSEQYKDELVYSKDNGFLVDHPIVRGREGSESVKKVVTFTGQTLTPPDSASVLLRLSEAATHVIPDSVWEIDGKTYTRFTDPMPAPGGCQGLAMNFGKGRVVILGEAAMLTAQIAYGKKFGMNAPGNDNKQFALNIMHWLSRALD